jgi:hypothetical protein
LLLMSTLLPKNRKPLAATAAYRICQTLNN